ncbi:MAG: amino acid carrier protein [Clostridia bacterium]|nr:amino acid carrier protein [Clostridia bacterium]
MENIIFKIEALIWGLPLIALLMITHIYFTIKLKFPQKNLPKGIKNMLISDKKNSAEGISSFKSLMTILAGTLGTGNIIGVSTAVIIGGPGSIFWICISGLFAVSTKYAETYIALKYRKRTKKGYVGGAMYILKDRLGNTKLASFFAISVILATFGMGSMIQSNAISSSIYNTFDININLVAICVTIICAYTVFGNERKISNISTAIIPITTVVYVIMCVGLAYIFRSNILNAISLIITEAFKFTSVSGGVLGSIAIIAMKEGLSKGLFSNEAGLGSSPLFDITVKENNIKKQSIISSTSVFIDTVLLCTFTGILVVASGVYDITNNPVILVSEIFSRIPYGNLMLTFSITAFALATIPCWSYYGASGVKYLFKSKISYEITYKLLYVTCIFIGCISTVGSVWSLSNIANALMAIPNIYMMFCLRKEIV